MLPIFCTQVLLVMCKRIHVNVLLFKIYSACLFLRGSILNSCLFTELSCRFLLPRTWCHRWSSVHVLQSIAIKDLSCFETFKISLFLAFGSWNNLIKRKMAVCCSCWTKISHICNKWVVSSCHWIKFQIKSYFFVPSSSWSSLHWDNVRPLTSRWGRTVGLFHVKVLKPDFRSGRAR